MSNFIRLTKLNKAKHIPVGYVKYNKDFELNDKNVYINIDNISTYSETLYNIEYRFANYSYDEYGRPSNYKSGTVTTQPIHIMEIIMDNGERIFVEESEDEITKLINNSKNIE